ncbi:hypothetical protein Hanom_Chr16g01468061 [Helianthus anomalus]
MGKLIILNEYTITEAFHFKDDIKVTSLTHAKLEDTLCKMGSVHTPTRQIVKSGFTKPWQFLVTQLGLCFLKKTINFNEISYKLMEPVHAPVHRIPYNFSHYRMRHFVLTSTPADLF